MINKCGITIDSLDTIIGNITTPVLIDVVDVVITACGQFCPVCLAAVSRNAKAVRIVYRMRKTGRIPHHLFRHAAVIDTSATEAVCFNYGDLFAIFGCFFCRCKTATATADDDKIEMLPGHEFSSD